MGAGEPRYGDFSNAVSYQQSLNTVIMAQNAFDALSDKLKRRFDGDPAKLLEFVYNDANRDEAISLGLLKPEAVAAQPTQSGAAAASSADTSADS